MKCGVPRLKEQPFTGELGEIGRGNIPAIAGVAINPRRRVDVDLRQPPAERRQQARNQKLEAAIAGLVYRDRGRQASTDTTSVEYVVGRGLHVIHEEYNKVGVGSAFLSLLNCVVLLLRRPGWPRRSATTVEAVR